MKPIKNDRRRMAGGPANGASSGAPSFHPSPATRRTLAFTLLELLVVISIMAVLAAFTVPVMHSLKRQQYIRTAQAELGALQGALEDYKAKYGVYPPGNSLNNPLLSQLYYELSGTTNNGTYYVTLDGSSQIYVSNPGNDVKAAYGVGGFINCSKGGGEEAVLARNFLTGLKPNQMYYPVTNNTVPTTILVTSVGGPDASYQPLSAPGLNPFRYVYPGVNNPGGYDLWVQLNIGSSFTSPSPGVYVCTVTNQYLVCNWSKSAQKNAPFP